MNIQIIIPFIIIIFILFYVDVHIKEVPADVKKPFQNVPGSDISDDFPICVQLPTKHLKKSHITANKTRRHRKISRSSTSTLSRMSLKAPVEGKQHLKLHLTQ